jgi:hypothetical protein
VKGAAATTIEITSPAVEALIRQRMEAGSFKSPEDLIREVLKSSPDEKMLAPASAAERRLRAGKAWLRCSRLCGG